MDKKEVKEYLKGLDIPNEDKNFVLDFMEKNEYIYDLVEKSEKMCGMAKFDFGYGNVDSNIVLVFDDVASANASQKCIDKIFSHANCEEWTVYVTFVDKYADYKGKIDILFMEIAAVNPKVAYIISDRDLGLAELFKKNGVEAPKFCKVSPSLLADVDDKESMNKAWKSFRHIINYKDKTIR